MPETKTGATHLPRKPIGDVAMTSTERVHRYRERQRAKRGPALTDREKLNQARAEIGRLRKRVEELEFKPAAKATSAPKGEAAMTLDMIGTKTGREQAEIFMRQQAKSFEATVNAEVRRRIDTADDYTRNRLRECERQLLQFERQRGKRGVFSKRQFKQMQILCHPDNSASPELRGELLQVLIKNELSLVNPEKK
jgi:hypothetical protein